MHAGATQMAVLEVSREQHIQENVILGDTIYIELIIIAILHLVVMVEDLPIMIMMNSFRRYIQQHLHPTLNIHIFIRVLHLHKF